MICHSVIRKYHLFSIILLLLLFGFAKTQELKSTDNQADYLIISCSQFADSLQPLISLRESQGLNVKLVDIEQIYREFQDTLSRQEAVRHFTSYALEYWTDPEPQFLLLAGDVEFVPSYKVQSRNHDSPYYNEDSVSIDDHYAINLYQDDFKPDLAIGRLPVSSNEQISIITQKILRFENELSRIDYLFDFTGLADQEIGDLFEEKIEELIDNSIPDFYRWQRVDRRDSSPFYGTRNDIVDKINQGTFFLDYHGHGHPAIWADSSFFSIDDLASLSANKRPFILTAAACNQLFDIPDSLTLVECLLLKKDCGTVMSLASAGLFYLTFGHDLVCEFYETLFSDPSLPIGEIIRETKCRSRISDRPDDFVLRYTLLGDPGLRLPADLVTRINQGISFEPCNFELYQNYPNPFNPSTVIHFALKQAGPVNLSIYNSRGRLISRLLSGSLGAGGHKLTWEPKLLSSGIYFIRLEFEGSFLTKRTLYIK